MSKECIDNERIITLGVPPSPNLFPVVEQGYTTGQEMALGEFVLFLNNIPSFYPYKLDGVPREKLAQLEILSATTLLAAQIGDETTANELLNLQLEYGAGPLKRKLLQRNVKKSLQQAPNDRIPA